MRKKLNAEFKGFIDLSQRLFKDKMPFEFDIPYRELGFYGSPFKSAVLISSSLAFYFFLVGEVISDRWLSDWAKWDAFLCD